MSARRLMLWTLPLWLLPPLSIAVALYLAEQQPPCPGGFIDGPCDPAYDPFGLHYGLFWLGLVAGAVEVLALTSFVVLGYLRRRSPTGNPH